MVFTDDRGFALQRVYGNAGVELLPELRIAVIGVGGVGSWAVEALARTGVGHLTLIDHDDVTVSNINRQLPALDSTVGLAKVQVLKARIADINPQCNVAAEEDFLVEKNLEHYLERDFDMVIDAIDNIRFKAAMINFCRRRKISIVTTGGAGGRVNPLAVDVADLSLTWNDALAANVRSKLRADYGYSRNPKRRFGVDCVYSTEQPVYPDGVGGVTRSKPGVPSVRLDCAQGYGSTSFVTGTFGLVAAAHAVSSCLASRLKAK